MKEKIEVEGVETEGLEVVDLGDAAKETRQPHTIQVIQDTAISWTYFTTE